MRKGDSTGRREPYQFYRYIIGKCVLIFVRAKFYTKTLSPKKKHWLLKVEFMRAFINLIVHRNKCICENNIYAREKLKRKF